MNVSILQQSTLWQAVKIIYFNTYINTHTYATVICNNSFQGGPRGRVGKVAEFQRSSSFDHLTVVTLSPALATCETSQVLLAGVSGGFPGVLPFRPTYRLACLNMSE